MRKRAAVSTMATATEEQRARDKGGRTRTHTPGFLILVSARNCVARHGAFREDDNAARVMRMSMQPPMQPPMQRAREHAAGRSGVNSLWSPALKAPIGRAIMLCRLRYKYSSRARPSRTDDGTRRSVVLLTVSLTRRDQRLQMYFVERSSRLRDPRGEIHARLYVSSLRRFA